MLSASEGHASDPNLRRLCQTSVFLARSKATAIETGSPLCMRSIRVGYVTDWGGSGLNFEN
jgi:hypothetical protein